MEKKKMKLGKKILIVFLVIFAIFILIVGRKMIILKRLQNKAEQYREANNYKAIIREYQGNGIQVFTTYKRNEKALSVLKRYTEKDVRKLTNYSDNEVKHTFIEVGEDKIAILKGNDLPAMVQIEGVSTGNLWQFITMSIFSDIQKEECNGKQCYKIYFAYSLTDRLDEKKMVTTYYDRQTGLKVREFNGTSGEGENKINMVSDYRYEFDIVNEEDIKEPNISEYTVQDN